MKLGLGILVVYLTIYTAKSLYIDVNNNSNKNIYNESNKAIEQQKSDLFQKVIDVPEIKVNLLPTTSKSTSSILNKLLPHESPQKDEISPTFKRVTLFPPLPPIDNLLFMQQDNNDDTSLDMQNAEMIEIEVPLIGSEYTRKVRDMVDMHGEDEEEEYYNTNEEVENSNGYIEINVIPTTSQAVNPDTTDESTFFNTDFQSSTNSEENTESFHQTSSSTYSTTDNVSPYSTLRNTVNEPDMHAIESKLMDQYHSMHTSEENTERSLSDKLIFKKEEATDDQQKHHSPKQYQHKFPFNVKVIVNNNGDPTTSCKNKKSCSQVSFSKNHDIDQEYYKDDSDDDLFFMSETDQHHNEKPNQLKSRRAADDRIFSAFNPLSLTPAPRFSGLTVHNNQFGMPLKKPSFIERLENESSLERSERVNKDLNNLMKLVAVWAHVDKFVSERARTTMKKLAFMADDDYVDNFVVGNRRKIDNSQNTIPKQSDEPFT